VSRPSAKLTVVLVAGSLLGLTACVNKHGSSTPGGWSTIAALPAANATPTPAPSPAAPPSSVEVTLGEASADQMFIHLSSPIAAAGKVTFTVTNQGTHTHEFVVLSTDTPADSFPIASFEGEKDRIDEDAAGTNVGETGDMEPGTTKTLSIDLSAGHYAVVCNLPGHYRMGMHQDFTVS
jgi:uncharacterized cupredoxin-like copper-binding protein